MDWMRLLRATKLPAIIVIGFSVLLIVATYVAENYGSTGALGVVFFIIFLGMTAANYDDCGGK